MSDTPELLAKGAITPVTNQNIPVGSTNLNKSEVHTSVDNHNLNKKFDLKYYDSKLSPMTLPPNLNVDPQNYMLRCGRDGRESGNGGRARSLSFSDCTMTMDQIYPKINQLSSRQQSISTNPLDLDMFCLRESVNSLSTLEPQDVMVPYQIENFESINEDTPATLGCARTLSFHSFLCTCHLSCCCMCDSLFPPDCDACMLGVCIHLTTTHLCYRTVDIFPSFTSMKDKNTEINDEVLQKTILVCVDDPCRKLGPEAAPCSDAGDMAQHCFVKHSFSSLERCDKCNKYIRGLLHQGLVCQDCGYISHLQCSNSGLPLCLPSSVERPKLRYRSAFGQGLCTLFDVKEQAAPLFVTHCCQEIEFRARTEGTQLYLYTLFKGHVCPDKLYELCCKFNEAAKLKGPLCTVDLSAYEVHVVAAALKKFLHELPDPVIPVQWYDRFVEASRIRNDEQCGAVLFGLAQQMPDHHRSTLSYLMAVLCRLSILQHERGTKEPPFQLIQVLCHIIIRPPWERIIQVVYNTETHIRIMEMLLMHGNWGEQLPEFVSAPALPPRKISRPALPVAEDLVEMPRTLQEAEWYWGDITRDEVNDKLMDTPDGTFLVRNALSKGGEYTLTLRKGGSNKLIKICHRSGKYGFSEPFKFNTVVELVNFYRGVSLAQYNPTLDIKLLYPVSRFQQEEEISSSTDTSKVVQRLVELDKEYEMKTKLYDDYSEDFVLTSKEIQMKRQALDAFSETVAMFEDQIRLQERFQKEAQPHEIKSLVENAELLRQRLKSLQESREQLEENLKQRVAYNRSLEREMHALKPEVFNILKLKEKHAAWLDCRGVKSQRIGDKLSVGRVEVDEFPHHNQDTWMLDNCSRSEAERLLVGRKDGTFLVRPSRTGQFALSITCNGTINHCIIYQTERGYGFAEPYNIYRSLKSLVLHYAQNSLEEHNDSLTTTLAYPVRARDCAGPSIEAHMGYVTFNTH